MRLVVACLLVAVSSPLRAAEGRRLALIIGVDQFDDAVWPSLRWARKDARDFYEALGDFDRRVLLGADASPTVAEVRVALRDLAGEATHADDTVVVYVSTHGTLARNDKGELERVLVLRDTRQDRLLTTGLNYDELVAAVDALPSRKKLIVLAACHAGAGKSALPAGLAAELRQLKGAFFGEPVERRDEGRIVLSASAWGEPAREDDALANDIYTHFFLEGLRSYDRNADGVTTALEAHDYARERTTEYTKGSQRPTLTAEIVGADPIVLRGKTGGPGRPVIAAYGPRVDGARLFVDGRDKGGLPGGYVVEPGTHRVVVMRPEAREPLLERRLDVGSEPLWLDPLLEPRAPSFGLELGLSVPWLPRSRVGAAYLPPYVLPRVTLLWSGATPLVLAVGLGGTYAHQGIEVASGEGRADTSQRLALGELSLAARYPWHEDGALRLDVAVSGSFSVGRRELADSSFVPRTQVVSFGTLALELGAGVAVSPRLQLRGALGAGGVAMSIDGKATVAPRVMLTLAVATPL